MKISCEIIKDLLPLYEDGVLSAESEALVKEHLSGCQNCKAFDENSKEEIAKLNQAAQTKGKKAINPFKKLKKIKLRTVVVSAVITAVVVTSAFFGVEFFSLYRNEYWHEINVMFNMSQEKIVSNKEYTQALSKLIAEEESWSQEEIKFNEDAVFQSYSRFGEKGKRQYMFTRKFEYRGEKYICEFSAIQNGIKEFDIFECTVKDSGAE